MKKIILTAVILTMAALSVNVLASTTTSQASVTVPGTCGLAATDISFSSLAPGMNSTDVTSTVSMPSGNTNLVPTIKGNDWTGTPSGSMVVGQTHWYMSDVVYGSMTALTTGEVSLGIGQNVSYGNPKTVHFKLGIQPGQTAANYTQTITFTATC